MKLGGRGHVLGMGCGNTESTRMSLLFFLFNAKVATCQMLTLAINRLYVHRNMFIGIWAMTLQEIMEQVFSLVFVLGLFGYIIISNLAVVRVCKYLKLVLVFLLNFLLVSHR